MRTLLKLSPHHHSGLHHPHEHTSYFLLASILVLTGVVLSLMTITSYAQSPPPQSESMSLSGVMPEEPPSEAATIRTPLPQQRFDTSPITVTGTCPGGTLVEILKNNIFAGSTLCTDTGTFSIDIDLLLGENELSARVYNALNQPGPLSNLVRVFYDALPPQSAPLTPLQFANTQLLLSTDAIFRGTFPNETMTLPLEIINGVAPFALDVQWGDNNNLMVPRDSNQPFRVSHIYRRPGTYQVNIRATDAEGRVAFLTTVAIINGQPAQTALGASGGSDAASIAGLLALLWPIFAATFGMVISFWMGEKREKRLLQAEGVLIS